MRTTLFEASFSLALEFFFAVHRLEVRVREA